MNNLDSFFRPDIVYFSLEIGFAIFSKRRMSEPDEELIIKVTGLSREEIQTLRQE